MMTKEEAILEARRKHCAHEFDRKIVRRVPVEFAWDTAELECGHSVSIAAFHADTRWSCSKCRDRWIDDWGQAQ